MLVVGVLDWTLIISSTIAAVVSVANGLGVAIVLTRTRAPSKRKLGELVEETHSITAGRMVEQLQRIDKGVNGEGDKHESAA